MDTKDHRVRSPAFEPVPAEKERARIIREREAVGPHAMRALFGPRGRLVPNTEEYV